MYPKVLITGHPNSGTSFLCNLVAEMGLSPGDPDLLKPADAHNPHGYWEHVPLQYYVRQLSGYSDWMHISGAYPLEPLVFTPQERLRIARLFMGAGVEVFKDTGLPVMYGLFSQEASYLITTRDERAMYESPGANYEGRGVSFDRFCRNVKAYRQLCAYVLDERRCLIVGYEDFRRDFDNQARRIANFLHVEADIPRLRGIWKPRQS